MKNREIKFRGKRLANDEWCYGSLLIWADGECTILEKSDSSNAVWKREINPDTVGLFTGLCDRNGKEIYEGDIVRNESAGFCGVVQYRDATFIIFLGEMNGALLICLQTGSLEIIGNIHDNPELLKGGEQ